jgi:DNA-binding transcriptional ArsR family regulator
MVYYSAEPLDRVFAALADPTRRALVTRLADRDSLSVSELAAPLAMSLPAVMKHLDMLSQAGLLTREKTGRTVTCRLRVEPMREANEWLNRYQRFWNGRLNQLVAFLEEDPCLPPSSPSRASLSSADSTPLRRKSSRPGHKPKS